MRSLEQIAADPRVTIHNHNSPNPDGECIVYWMRSSQRGEHNDAVNAAVEVANLLGKPVVVFFGLVTHSVRANLRHYSFLVGGLADIADALQRRNISFVLRCFPEHSILKFCEEVRPALVISDENPLRESVSTREKVARKLKVAFWTIDSNVIVPSKLLLKEQYAAHIIRNRLAPLIQDFLVPSRDVHAKVVWREPNRLMSAPLQTNVLENLKIDRSVQPVSSIRGGSKEADRWLRDFIKHKLAAYPKQRNHPEVEGTSRLSAYLHFGHISPKTIALAVQQSEAPKTAKDVFLDQLRRMFSWINSSPGGNWR